MVDLHVPRGSLLVQECRTGEEWIGDACILGIDEAGRGPVLGPMVYGCVFAPKAADLSRRQFADSKTLTAEKRVALMKDITGDTGLGYAFEVLSAELISNAMLALDRTSLNAIAADSTIKLIRTVLDAGVQVKEVYIDTVGDAERYAEKLQRIFPDLAFTVCPKADALYPVVSAASIVAKVSRDHALEACQQDVGPGPSSQARMGTGYPADPDTKTWLKRNVHAVWGFPCIVRFSWETCARLLEEEAVAIKWEADDGSSDGAGQQRISFAPAGGAGSKAGALTETSGAGRHSYFRFRKLQRLNECF